ncbi:MAG: hypothetical protein WCA20_07075 [Candidatus Sulfotelmatobacter sp.]
MFVGRFHHTADLAHAPDSKLEAADHKAEQAIQNIVDLLAAHNLTYSF